MSTQVLNGRAVAGANARLIGAAAATASVAGVGVAYAWRRYPSPFPHYLRFFLRHPLIGRERLLEVLDPKPGESLLEIGPGTGYYALGVARALGEGTLDLLDVQPAMLNHTVEAGRADGLNNLRPSISDGGSPPYPDDSFDGAYLCEVIGEIPDQDATFRGLRRVIRPGGRLVVGESLLSCDVHFMTSASVQRRAEAAGFTFDRRVGSWLGYFSVFRS